MVSRLRSLLVSAFAITLVTTGTAMASVAQPAETVPVARPEAATTVPLTKADGAPTGHATAGLGSGETPGRSAVRTAELEVPEFVVAALTWDATDDLAADAVIEVRVRESRGWSDWLEVEADDAGPEGGTGRAGTDPFITGGATAAQVRIDGRANDLPANLSLDLIPADATGEVEVLGGATGGAGTTSRLIPPVGGPGVVPATVDVDGVGTVFTRADWGADEAYTDENWTPRYAPLRAAVVHHTAGTNTYTAAQSPGIVKAIFTYHTVTRGWGDIGYNFLVDQYGQIFEGRKYSIAAHEDAPQGWMIEAGHALGYNRGSLGISAMGDFTLSTAPDATSIVNAMAKVIAWKFKAANLDSTAPSGFFAPTSRSFTTYAAGAALPRIFGHGDVALTACPGGLYTRLGDLRSLVKAGYTRSNDVTPPTVQATVGVDGLVRLSAADTQSAVTGVFFTLDGSAMFWSPADAVDPDIPETRYDEPIPAAMITTLSVVAVDDAGNSSTPTTPTVELITCAADFESGDGVFYLNDVFSGTANTVFAYGLAADAVYLGDWDGDGIDTPAIRRGNLFLIRNVNCSGDPDLTVAYGKPDDVVLVGDWDGDGVDTFAVRRGATYYFRNTVTTGVADAVITYGRPEDVVLVGDWEGNRVDSLAVRRDATYYIRNSISSGVADYTFTYGRADDEVLVGDWDGNGTDTLAVRRGITYYIRNTTTSGVADLVFNYGRLTDLSFAGDWNADSSDTIGIRRAIP